MHVLIHFGSSVISDSTMVGIWDPSGYCDNNGTWIRDFCGSNEKKDLWIYGPHGFLDKTVQMGL